MEVVDIIIPTYNRAALLTRAIESVLLQTYQDFNIIIVDDASTDNTEEIVKSFADKRISYIRHPVNKGEAASRNTGIRASTSKYIAFQDSDDEWFSEKLEKQIKVFEVATAEVGVVYGGFWKVENNVKTYIPFSWVQKKSGFIFDELLKGNFVGAPTVIVRKECFAKVGLFDERLFHLVDWEMWLRISKQYQFLCVDEPLMCAYYHTDNVSNNKQALINALKLIMVKHFEDFKQDKKLLAKHYIDIGDLLLQTKQLKEGRGYLLKALSLDITKIKWAVVVLATLSGQWICKKVMLLRKNKNMVRD